MGVLMKECQQDGIREESMYCNMNLRLMNGQSSVRLSRRRSSPYRPDIVASDCGEREANKDLVNTWHGVIDAHPLLANNAC